MLGSPARCSGDRLGSRRAAERLPQHPGSGLVADCRTRPLLPPASAGSRRTGRRRGCRQMWQQIGHDGVPRSIRSGPSRATPNALTGLTSQPFWGFLPEATKQECLECHSADYRILEEAGENPTSADAKYGVTCVGCHTPHEAGTTEGGAWDEEWTPQLRTTRARGEDDLCVECHNGEIPEGTTAVAGYRDPSSDEGDDGRLRRHRRRRRSRASTRASASSATCRRRVSAAAACSCGGNHTFNIIEPEGGRRGLADPGRHGRAPSRPQRRSRAALPSSPPPTR